MSFAAPPEISNAPQQGQAPDHISEISNFSEELRPETKPRRRSDTYSRASWASETQLLRYLVGRSKAERVRGEETLSETKVNLFSRRTSSAQTISDRTCTDDLLRSQAVPSTEDEEFTGSKNLLRPAILPSEILAPKAKAVRELENIREKLFGRNFGPANSKSSNAKHLKEYTVTLEIPISDGEDSSTYETAREYSNEEDEMSKSRQPRIKEMTIAELKKTYAGFQLRGPALDDVTAADTPPRGATLLRVQGHGMIYLQQGKDVTGRARDHLGYVIWQTTDGEGPDLGVSTSRNKMDTSVFDVFFAFHSACSKDNWPPVNVKITDINVYRILKEMSATTAAKRYPADINKNGQLRIKREPHGVPMYAKIADDDYRYLVYKQAIVLWGEEGVDKWGATKHKMAKGEYPLKAKMWSYSSQRCAGNPRGKGVNVENAQPNIEVLEDESEEEDEKGTAEDGNDQDDPMGLSSAQDDQDVTTIQAKEDDAEMQIPAKHTKAPTNLSFDRSRVTTEDLTSMIKGTLTKKTAIDTTQEPTMADFSAIARNMSAEDVQAIHQMTRERTLTAEDVMRMMPSSKGRGMTAQEILVLKPTYSQGPYQSKVYSGLPTFRESVEEHLYPSKEDDGLSSNNLGASILAMKDREAREKDADYHDYASSPNHSIRTESVSRFQDAGTPIRSLRTPNLAQTLSGQPKFKNPFKKDLLPFKRARDTSPDSIPSKRQATEERGTKTEGKGDLNDLEATVQMLEEEVITKNRELRTLQENAATLQQEAETAKADIGAVTTRVFNELESMNRWTHESRLIKQAKIFLDQRQVEVDRKIEQAGARTYDALYGDSGPDNTDLIPLDEALLEVLRETE